MSAKPEISVIVPCYKQAHFLAEALASVQAQTMQDWECIIVNDGSPDNTATVAQEWVKKDSRFRYIEKPNGGVSSARNRGLLEARGDYIQFLDEDDLIEPGKFAWQVELLRNRLDLGIVYSDVRYFPAEAPQERRFTIFGPDEPWVERAWLEPRPFLDKLLERNMMPVNCPIVKRSVIDRIGLFDETLCGGEDWHYLLRCAATGTEFYFAPAPGTLALVRIHRVSASQNRNRMQSETFKMRVLVGATLTNPDLRRRNFQLGVGLITAHSQASVELQLLRLAWANRGLNIILPFLSAHLSRDSRLFKTLSFLRKAGNENALSS